MMCIVERQESPATEPRITLGRKSKNCRMPILDWFVKDGYRRDGPYTLSVGRKIVSEGSSADGR